MQKYGRDNAEGAVAALEPDGTNPRVVPIPQTNNLNPIICKSAAVSSASLPVNQRAGVATASLFVDPARRTKNHRQVPRRNRRVAQFHDVKKAAAGKD
jgi:hypothetical protein